MTGNLLLDSLISLGAIALMVACAWVFFPAKAPSVTEDMARERLAFDEPDFTPVAWLFDSAGRAALARGEGGDVAIVSWLGLDLVTRRVPATAIRTVTKNGVVSILPNDPGARAIRIAQSDAAKLTGLLAGATAG